VATRPPDNLDDGDLGENVDADQVEEDWNRALDVASHAVDLGGRSHLLSPPEVSAEVEHIRADRTWLGAIKPTLRRLLPRRRKKTG